ncbi:anti-sigma factor family protein [Niveispirillum sp. KHB5.9]|uniref:anti-sigma factor family protein n=1 Tax=Niveispirillum sp. KHB5.9 TaxID=3400269 RepID=UPI003A8AEF62
MHPFDPITEDDLNAYIDGGLDARRRAEVERWLAQYPDEAARIMADLGDADLLREGLGETAFATPLDAGTRHLAGRLRRQLIWRGATHVLQRALMILLPLAAGYGLSWLPTGGQQSAEAAHIVPLFADEAAEAYRTAMKEVGADRALTYAETDLPAKLAATDGTHPLPIPAPPSARWQLMGAQMTAWDHGDAVQVFWKHETKGTAVLFVSEDTAEPGQPALPPTVGHTDEGDVVYWRSGPFVYALLGTTDIRSLERVAHLIARPNPGR